MWTRRHQRGGRGYDGDLEGRSACAGVYCPSPRPSYSSSRWEGLCPFGEAATASRLPARLVPLGANQQQSFEVNLNVPARSGSLFNRFAVDAENAVAESDESNNILDRTVLVTPTSPAPTLPPIPTPTAVSITAPPAP